LSFDDTFVVVTEAKGIGTLARSVAAGHRSNIVRLGISFPKSLSMETHRLFLPCSHMAHRVLSPVEKRQGTKGVGITPSCK
jgi:hypothetical protein